jgi:hypothetical protein
MSINGHFLGTTFLSCRQETGLGDFVQNLVRFFLEIASHTSTLLSTRVNQFYKPFFAFNICNKE